MVEFQCREIDGQWQAWNIRTGPIAAADRDSLHEACRQAVGDQAQTIVWFY
jgi:hypothetical protein